MTTNEYKQAVWEFMLEHSDITPNGSVFVKFHCDGRKNFENRIRGRYKGYHREDVKAKEETHTSRKEAHKASKKVKEEKYKRDKKFRMIKKKIIDLITFKKS